MAPAPPSRMKSKGKRQKAKGKSNGSGSWLFVGLFRAEDDGHGAVGGEIARGGLLDLLCGDLADAVEVGGGELPAVDRRIVAEGTPLAGEGLVVLSIRSGEDALRAFEFAGSGRRAAQFCDLSLDHLLDAVQLLGRSLHQDEEETRLAERLV